MARTKRNRKIRRIRTKKKTMRRIFLKKFVKFVDKRAIRRFKQGLDQHKMVWRYNREVCYLARIEDYLPAMKIDFDQVINRIGSDSVKWNAYGPDILPLPVADMDFLSPEPVIQALARRTEHGVFGYAADPTALRAVIVARLERLYGWKVSSEAIVWLPGVITGFNLAMHAFARPGEGTLMQPPVYQPFLSSPRYHGLTRQDAPLTRQADGSYTIDFDAFEAAITRQTRIFILCNPHNPVGRVFTQDELRRMAEICLRHDVLICSDEIHCDLIFSGHRHTPIASLSPEVSRRTVTLMAPSKTFNIAGLDCAFAIIEDEALRHQYNSARHGLVGGPNLLGLTAALAAYQDGGEWLDALLVYLEGNRDFLVHTVRSEMPQVQVQAPEGTYLAWLDFRQAGIQGAPSAFLLEHAKVALSDGPSYGTGGEGYARLNFGTPRSILAEALERMRRGLP
jgi:cystathionine beta-lyase